MKKLFYAGIIGLALFEVLNVYFIMPMPGSQEMYSIDLAYFLYRWRWVFRVVFGAFILFGSLRSLTRRSWLMWLSLLACAVVVGLFNFKMAADKMFHLPKEMVMADGKSNTNPLDKLVIGLDMDGEARAYPIQLIAYHHQVLDTVKGKPVMVTYCSVCRTGRIFEPKINGRTESFRLVGMDHFNAMFEDETTKSWWRQATGEAIAGTLKGEVLPEIFSEQTTLRKWLELHPHSKVMQPDPEFLEEYKGLQDYDHGVERGALTRTDTLSWGEKSWVVGVRLEDSSRAIDWNRLKKERLINLELSGRPVFVVLAGDDQSFFAFERPHGSDFTIRNDTLVDGDHRYTLLGNPESGVVPPLKKVKAYQEFWHSWRTFRPETIKIE